MRDDHSAAAGLDQHGRGDFTGKGALGSPIDVLGGDADGRARGGLDAGRERGERRGDDHLGLRSSDQRLERGEE